MEHKSHFNRRLFIQSQVGLVSILGLGGMSRMPGRAQPRRSTAWDTATADQLTKLIGQSFTAVDKDKNIQRLKLTLVEAHKPGAARPKNLARSQGITLVFSSDKAAQLAEQGHQTMAIRNQTLGESELYMGAVPLKNGGYEIELILN